MKLKLDEYDIKAKVVPTFISIIPLLVLSHFYLYSKIEAFILWVVGIELFGQITSSALLTYFLMEFCRFIGLQYEDFYFKNGLYMPTTNYLMYSDTTLSYQYKTKIRAKIKTDFSVDLPDAVAEKENELSARQATKESVGYIRKNVKKGYLLHNRNIQYGLGRNLVGGATFALTLCILNSLIFSLTDNHQALNISIIIGIIYLFIVILSRKLLSILGKKYADTLFEEYLSPDIE